MTDRDAMAPGRDTAPDVRRATDRQLRRRPLTPGFVVATTAMMWLATAVAAAAFWPVYESPRYIVMVAATTIVATGIAITGAVLKLPGRLVAAIALLAYALLGVPLAIPDRAAFGVVPTVDGLVDLATGTALGWKQLLTITLPVGEFESLLVPAFVVVLVTVTASLSVALRAKYGEFAVAGPVLLFLTGVLFGPTSEFAPVAIGLGLTAVLLLWIVWFRLYRRRRAILAARSGQPASAVRDPLVGSARIAIGAVVIIGIAAGGAVVATSALPPRADRTVLRSTIDQPFDPREYPSPLSAFRNYHKAGAAESTMLTVDGLPPGGRIRIATLDSYDGVVYAVGSDRVDSESGSFVLVPSSVDQSGVVGEQESVEITVGDYSGVWVPTVGDLESVRFEGQGSTELRGAFYYNDNSATAAVIGGLDTGDRYRLTAVQPRQPDDSELASLEPGDAVVPDLGEVPDALSVALNSYIANAGSPGEQLVAAITALRSNGYISHGQPEEERSRSGHSANRIAQLFDDQRMIGDGEQYAVTAAVMARELGFPARVVVGFAPTVTGPTTTVVGSDIAAWIEVDTAGSGWVTIDPTPPVREIPEEQPQQPRQIARPQQPVQPPVEEPVVPDEQTPPDSEQDDPPAVDPILAALLVALSVLGWAAVAAALVLAPFVAIIATKLRRRRRRDRAPDPLDRISGGWDEFEDAVLDHGYASPPSPTRSEFAGVIGGSRPALLAAAADRAVFAPTPPDAEAADAVWTSVRELTASLDQGLTRRQRWRAMVSLRSLRRRPEDTVAETPAGEPRATVRDAPTGTSVSKRRKKSTARRQGNGGSR